MTCPSDRKFMLEQMAQADRCDREKVQNLYPWMLYQDPPAKQQWTEPNDRQPASPE